MMPVIINDAEDMSEALFIHEIARQMRTVFDRRVNHLGLTRSQWRVLSILRRRPGIRQTQLAEMMEVEPITLARLLDRMEHAGWVERSSDPSDRRANMVRLMPKVASILSEMQALSAQVRRESLKDFTQEEHDALLGYLRRMKHNVCGMLAASCESEKV
jgi:MarR family transcriptional regulator for hemolysin